jgi:hypothetical protein
VRPFSCSDLWGRRKDRTILVVDDLLLALVAILLLPVVLLTGVAVLATSTMRRVNRVVAGRSVAAAPVRWLWSPSAAAMLHRRLRSACELAGSVAGSQARAPRWPRRKARPASDGIADLAREVLEEAVLLDRQVVSANRMARGLPRAQALSALDYQVRAIEDAARRVHQLAARRAHLARPNGSPVLNLDQRITAMEEALRELTPSPPVA